MDEQRIRELSGCFKPDGDIDVKHYPTPRELCALCDLALEALASRRAGRWRHCAIHGDIDGTVAWGCPECVRDLRAEALRNRDVVRAAEALHEAEWKNVAARSIHDGWHEEVQAAYDALETARKGFRAALDARERKGKPSAG